jgi:hypothetical protein
MRERARQFERLAHEARDPVVHAELKRLALLYDAQADAMDRGEDQPSDPGEEAVKESEAEETVTDPNSLPRRS